MRLQQFASAFQLSDPDPVRTYATQQAVQGQWSQIWQYFMKVTIVIGFECIKIFKLCKLCFVIYYTIIHTINVHHRKYGKVIFCKSLLETNFFIDVIAKTNRVRKPSSLYKSTYCIYICKQSYSKNGRFILSATWHNATEKNRQSGCQKYVITTVKGRCGNFRCTSRVLMASYVTRHS